MSSSHRKQSVYSSRLPQIISQYQEKLQRIDALERRLEGFVSEKRQRALSILEETPSHRNSHLRLFVTHRYQEGEEVRPYTHPSIHPDNLARLSENKNAENAKSIPKKSNKWTLVIEGRLLVGHLDHERANNFEKEAARDNDFVRSYSQSDGKGEGSDAYTNLLPRSSANRTLYDREGEEPITPIKFTHFFDKISVSFQSFQRTKHEKENDHIEMFENVDFQPGSVSNSVAGRSKRLPRRDQLGTDSKERNLYKTNDVITNLSWDRESRKKKSSGLRTPDAHAFNAVYHEERENPYEERSVVATIRLHRRPGGEQKYLPSIELCTHLFTSFLPEVKMRSQRSSRRNEEQHIARNDDMPPKFSDAGVTQSAEDRPTSSAFPSNVATPLYKTPPLENTIHVPSLFTQNEVVDAIFVYAKDRKLFDKSDFSIIRNDSVLQRLFDCKEMTISVMKSLLLSRRLLQPILLENPEHDAAIECTYVMTKESAHPNLSGVSHGKPTSEYNLNSTQKLEPVAKKLRVTGKKDNLSTNRRQNVLDTEQYSTLSCDIDIDVPSLIHYRTRDILRRIKAREYEYTSSRAKAIRTVQSSGAEEDVIRERLDDIVKGRALTLRHTPVLLALAKSAPPGSEARKESHIDARTALLLDRLEHHSKMAKAFWNIVEACQAKTR